MKHKTAKTEVKAVFVCKKGDTIERVVKTIPVERGKLYVTGAGERYLLADCRAEIEIRQELIDVPMGEVLRRDGCYMRIDLPRCELIDDLDLLRRLGVFFDCLFRIAGVKEQDRHRREWPPKNKRNGKIAGDIEVIG